MIILFNLYFILFNLSLNIYQYFFFLKLDVMYIAGKLCSYQTLEHMWKYSKYKDSNTGVNKEVVKQAVGATQPKLVKSKSKSDNSNVNAAVPKFSLESFLESYLNNDGNLQFIYFGLLNNMHIVYNGNYFKYIDRNN